MALLNTGTIFGVLAAMGITTGLATSGGGPGEEPGGSFERACAGLPTSRQVEDTLATARALSNGGFDPICSSIQAHPART